MPDEKRYHAPVRVQESYALADDEEVEDKTHIVMGWLLGKSANLNDLLRAQLLSSVLLDNSASPLQRALETTDLGSAPSPLCGLEDSMRELTFVCGLEGSNAEQIEAFEQLVLGTIRDVADNGVPQERLEAVLHQLELHQREIGGDSYPVWPAINFERPLQCDARRRSDRGLESRTRARSNCAKKLKIRNLSKHSRAICCLTIHIALR